MIDQVARPVGLVHDKALPSTSPTGLSCRSAKRCNPLCWPYLGPARVLVRRRRMDDRGTHNSTFVH